MSSELPDVTRIEALPRETWSQLAERLRLAGFDAEYLGGVSKEGMRLYDVSLQRPVLLWRVRDRRDAAAYAYRIFILRDAVADHEAIALFGCRLVDELIEAGLLVRPAPGTIVSVLNLRVFRGLLILCDDLLHQGDAVFGVGVGTPAFYGLPTRRGVVPRALDVGCGAGAAALWLSRHAEHVVATDVNPRALAFLKMNAALNGISNVEGREGDLFQAVDGERFDIIASQPPYVPAAADAPAATYLYGGPLGNELVSRILSELPRHLSRDGRAMLVFEQARRSDTPEPDLGSVQMVDRKMCTLFIMSPEVDPDTYSIRYALPELRRSIAAFDRATIVMRKHLLKMNIIGVYSALCVLEHANGSSGWIETVQARDTLWSEVSAEAIERLLMGHALLHQPASFLSRTCVHIPDESLVVRYWTSSGCTNERTYLGLPPGYLLPWLELSQREWDALEELHSQERVESLPTELLVKFARAGLLK
jgi:SAM-dependent methyltransferase